MLPIIHDDKSNLVFYLLKVNLLSITAHEAAENYKKKAKS